MTGEKGDAVPFERALELNHAATWTHRVPPCHVGAMGQWDASCSHDGPALVANMSTAGRTARDVMLGLMKTCSKLKVSFFRYLGDRLHVPGAITILPLPDLVRQAATTV